MADAVSKLYAEIGFKVNQDGLKQAQKFLKSFAEQMTAINNATKEAAKQYGIFSKEQAKQEAQKAKLAIDYEKAENLRSKRRIEGKKFEHKELMDLAKLEFQVEKYNDRERNKIAKNQTKRLSDMLQAFRKFGSGLRNALLQLAGIGGMSDSMQQSFARSLTTRNFLMATGAGLSDLQGIMQRMVNTGSVMSQEQVMGDILKVSQNLEDIRLGGGGIVPYKLMGVAATGNVMNVIKATEEAVKGMNNATALNLTRRMGLSDDWLNMWRFKQRGGGDQVQLSQSQNLDIANAKVSLGQLSYGFRLLADQITAVLSPAFEELSDILRDSFQAAARYIKENSVEIKKTVSEITQKIVEVIRKIDWTKIGNAIETLYRGILKLAEAVSWILSKFGMSDEKKKSSSREGMYFEKHWWGGKWKPIPEYEPSTAGKYIDKSLSPDTLGMIGKFSSMPNRSGLINAIDNHVQNVTINGVAQEEIANQVKEVIEEEKTNKQIWGERFSDISDLWVVGNSSGNASVG